MSPYINKQFFATVGTVKKCNTPQDVCLGYIDYHNLATVYNTQVKESKKQVYILHTVLPIEFRVSEATSV